MTKSKVVKIIVAVLVATTLFIMLTQNSFCMVGDISTKFDGQLDKSNATKTVADIMGRTINFIQVIGMGVAIVILVVIGIKWVSASAMPSVKAEIAKTARYYILGAILIFSAIGILQIIKMFANTNVKDAV